MMVSISGERGVGKTLHLADRVFQRSRQGYFVVTNFSHSHSNLDCSGLSPEEFLDVILNIIDFKDNGYEMYNIHPSFRHTGIYVAMDEATIYFSPEMQSKLSKSNPDKYSRLLNLLAQARKYDVEIDYVVQDPAKVGKDFRRYTEHYKRFRWVFKLKRLAFVPHPRLPIFRREHRHLLDVVWEEIHDLDADNPRFNYSTITDEHGIQQWSPSSTLKERHLRLTGKHKKHILRMYNSYQPVAVRQEEYQKEFSPLKNFRVIPQGFKRDQLPTVKRMLRAIGIPVKIKDEYLPPKFAFPELLLPPKDEKNKIISEVQSQRHIMLTSDDLLKDIEAATKRPAAKKDAVAVREGAMLQTASSETKVIAPPTPDESLVPSGVPTRYKKKNDIKSMAKESQKPATVVSMDKVEEFSGKDDSPHSTDFLEKRRKQRELRLPTKEKMIAFEDIPGVYTEKPKKKKKKDLRPPLEGDEPYIPGFTSTLPAV